MGTSTAPRHKWRRHPHARSRPRGDVSLSVHDIPHLSTVDDLIIEDAPKDYDWGCGAGGNGQNRLGLILMAVRAILRSGGDTAVP